MEGYLLHHLLATGPADKTAIVEGTTRFDYAALRRAVGQMARWLKAHGVSPGDRVAIVLPKSFAECAALFAVSRADAVFVPVNGTLKDEQVRHIVSDCAAGVVITTKDRRSALMDALNDLEEPPIVVAADDMLAERACDEAQPLSMPQALGEDLAAILYTSGSTGRPKGVMLSHRNLLAGTRIVRTYLGIGPDERILSVLPFSFDYGLNQLLTAIEQGATTVLFSFRLGDQLVKALQDHRITGFAGVPSIWAILSRAAPSLPKTSLPHLRYITNSGGAVPSPTVARLRELLPATDIYLMYGLTEAFRSTYLPPADIDRKPTSIGKAIPECEVFPVTADGRRAKAGEIGTLVHRGPTVSLGYWNRPDDTARVLRPNPFRPPEQGGETVCYSGDLVVEDDDGYLYFVARDDAMIKSAGFRISPTEIEEVLMATESFAQVAVIGLPDEWTGQRLHAVGIPSNHARPPAEILKQVSARLPSHMVPKKIELVDELPVTANRKVDYKRLVVERT